MIFFIETTLDHIESEMAKRGVTQELIEEIRSLPETNMLRDIEAISKVGGDLEFRNSDGATPVIILLPSFLLPFYVCYKFQTVEA